MIVAASVPVLGVSPSAGGAGDEIGGGASMSSLTGAGFGSGLGAVFGGVGLGLTGAGFSCAGRGVAAAATLCP